MKPDEDELGLFNIKPDDYGQKYGQDLFEQYKLYVEMADKVSERRSTANIFFLTANMLLIFIYGAIAGKDLLSDSISAWFFLFALSGLAFSITWFYIVQSYRRLNSAKLKVLHEIEKNLPLALYKAEWTALGEGRDPNRHRSLTVVEKYAPLIFISIYILILFLSMALFVPIPNEDTVELQILSFNDFHGRLEQAPYLATQMKALKATNPNTIIASAGDCIGASEPDSASFHDEPTIEVLSESGLEYSAVGNHEFDKGVSELQRMQYGCCHKVDGCQDGDRFVGAGFNYLTANVFNNSTNKTIFPPYKVKEIEGIPVAFIGISLKDTPSIVASSDISDIHGLEFRDEADSINAVVRELKEIGIQTIIVLIHDGGEHGGLSSESMNSSGSKAIIDIVKRSSKEVDVFVTGHTHEAYVSTIDGRVVTQAGKYGEFLTDIDLVISKETGDVLSAGAKNVAVTRDVPKDADISEITEKYSLLNARKFQEIIGSITADIPKKPNDSGESALGDVIADTMLYATRENGAKVALMNTGGIRDNLSYKASKNEGLGNVTYEEAFKVLPFSNSIITMNLTGRQIDELLEKQFDNPKPRENNILQVSRGFNYTWNRSAPLGQKVDINSIKFNGKSVDPEGRYRIATNNFLAEGKDNFTIFKAGEDRVGRIGDLGAFIEYFKNFSPVSPGHADRIAVIGKPLHGEWSRR
jgi:5'-nucleotidase